MPDMETALMDTPVATDSGAAVETVSTPSVETTETPVTDAGREEAQPIQPERHDDTEKEDLTEFAPSISARLRELTKRSPDLDKALKSNPDLRNTLEATFRRDAAYREIFPTVAEARQLRETFPNGISDAQELLQELNEVAELDSNLVARDPEGRYPGHSKIIRDIFAQDRSAAVALLENSTREWSREDPESYSRVLGGIMGATFKAEGVLNHLAQLQNLAKSTDNVNLQQMVDQLADWVRGFTGDKGQQTLSPEAERLRSERQALDRDKAERGKADGEAFNKNFVAESTRLQKQIVENHPLLKRLPQAIPAQKRERIISEVMSRMRDHLQKSPSFMRSLKSQYQGMNLQGTLDVQRKTWNQPWLLNMYVRKVLAEETPGIIQATRPAARTAATNRTPSPAAAPGRSGPAHTAPYKQNGQWYKPSGQKMSMEEALRM